MAAITMVSEYLPQWHEGIRPSLPMEVISLSFCFHSSTVFPQTGSQRQSAKHIIKPYNLLKGFPSTSHLLFPQVRQGDEVGTCWLLLHGILCWNTEVQALRYQRESGDPSFITSTHVETETEPIPSWLSFGEEAPCKGSNLQFKNNEQEKKIAAVKATWQALKEKGAISKQGRLRVAGFHTISQNLAMKYLMSGLSHLQSKYINSWCEKCHRSGLRNVLLW